MGFGHISLTGDGGKEISPQNGISQNFNVTVPNSWVFFRYDYYPPSDTSNLTDVYSHLHVNTVPIPNSNVTLCLFTSTTPQKNPGANYCYPMSSSIEESLDVCYSFSSSFWIGLISKNNSETINFNVSWSSPNDNDCYDFYFGLWFLSLVTMIIMGILAAISIIGAIVAFYYYREAVKMRREEYNVII